MNPEVAELFAGFIGRPPTPEEAALAPDPTSALATILSGAEFRERVLLPVAAGCPLSTFLTAPVPSGRLAALLPLSDRGREAAAAARSRVGLVRAAFCDPRFIDEVHAPASLPWPPELLGRTRPGEAPAVTARPVISLLMPVHDTPPLVLEAAIESVRGQTYPDWELCICDDASTLAGARHVLQRHRGGDPRVKITRSDRNLHIAAATNRAAEFATGAFVGFLDHDDLLTPDALEKMAQVIVSHPEGDVFYSDEDKLEPDGSRSEPYLKPDWSPEHLGSVAYVLHLMLVRKRLFLELGGVRETFTGAQDYDLSLRATARARQVVHVPHVLYHWRKLPGSAAAQLDAKPQALLAAARAVEDFAREESPGARVSPGLFTGSFRIEWPVSPARPVTLLMPTDSRRRFVEGRGDILLVEHAVNSILDRSTFRNFELVVVDNGAMPSDVRRRLEARDVRVETYAFQPPFNFSLKINAAFDHVRTEDVVILNDDIEVISPDWLEALLAHSRRPGVGAVGARLLYPDGRIQHAGVVLGVQGASAHIFHNQRADEIGSCGYSHVVRNYSAVTGAVLATRMSLVRWVGGFDPRLRIDYNDIDFCLRLGAAGFRSVYTPYASLHHFEGATLSRSVVTESDRELFQRRWSGAVGCDPFYNPALPRDRTDGHVDRW